MIVLASANEKVSWLKCFLAEIPLLEKLMPTMLIHYDGTATITKIKNHYYSGKRRQIRTKNINVRGYISKGDVRVDHVRTNVNLAYPLTKGLAREKV